MPILTTPHYNATAKFLHWVIALAIIFMLALGWVMTNLPQGYPNKFALFQLHKSVGITILALSLFRLVWRLIYKAPPLPAHMPRWEKLAANITHVIFYILIIGMPLSGWVLVSTSSFHLPTMLYGVIHLPNLPGLADLPDHQAINDAAAKSHGLAAYVLAALVVLHIGAAWKHHLVNRDEVLLRMAPGFMQGLLLKIRGGA